MYVSLARYQRSLKAQNSFHNCQGYVSQQGSSETFASNKEVDTNQKKKTKEKNNGHGTLGPRQASIPPACLQPG